ncbi:MAG: T9SS type A sorting domain-containing protein [bacterium]
MRAKLILLIVAIAIAAFTPLRAIPDAPILQVDTLVDLSKTGGGEAGGALFLPDGNIIALWKSIPHVIDSKTGEVIRRMDTVHSSTVFNPKLTKDGTKLVAISEGLKLNVWDVPSGKIIFQTKKEIMSFCISPDGTKMYITLPNNTDNPRIIAVYDMATSEEIERLAYPNMTFGYHIDISPDGQTLAVSVGKKINDNTDNQFILINLNDKQNYTTIESLQMQIYSMEFSPDGKQIAFRYDNGNGENYNYIYNLDTKEKKFIKIQELSTLFGFKVAYMGNPKFVDNNTILFQIGSEMDENIYYFSWNISENRLKNYVKLIYNQSIDVKNDLVLFCNSFGVIGYINKDIVPVINNIQKEVLLTYIDHRLEYLSDISFKGESIIYDLTGKTIMNLGIQQFVIGKNIIRINQPLPRGIYILTINDKTNQLSYKFIVE